MNEINEKKRVIDIVGELTDEYAYKIVNRILELDAESHEPIIVQICSLGGSVIGGLLIVDAIQSIESDIYTVGLGTCSSIASLILSAGKRGYRKVNKNIFALLHQPSGVAMGEIQNMNSIVDLMNKQKEQLILLYSEFTGKEPDIIRKDLDHDFVLADANEVIEYGLADKII